MVPPKGLVECFESAKLIVSVEESLQVDAIKD